MTLSMPVKIVALGALALALGLGGVTLLLKKPSSTPSAGAATPPPVQTVQSHTVVATATAHAPRAAPKPKPHIQINSNVPPLVASMLERHPIVVVVIYNSHIAGDLAVRKEAIAGAEASHAPWLTLNVSYNAVAAGVATWSDAVSDPAVLVVKRPGNITFGIPGETDRAAVAQAVANAR